MLRQVRQLSLLALVLASCTKEKESSPPPAAPAAEKKAEPKEAKNYEVSMSSPALKAGQESTAAVITVTATSGFHVNPEYPVSFRPEGSEAVKFSGERVALTAGTKTPCAAKAEDACKVEFPLPLTPEKAGEGKVAGVVAFSVCSEDKCLIEKVPLALAIKVE
jgi:hypothetical protein